MKKLHYLIGYILFFCFGQMTTTTAQEWSFGGELGATVFSFFDYTPVDQEGGSYDRGYNIPHNEGWILSYYPLEKKIFFSLGFTRYQSNNSDVLVRNSEGKDLRHISTGSFNHTISLNIGHQIDIGKSVRLDQKKLFFEPLYGIGIELLGRYTATPTSGLLELKYSNYETGINPSMQAGFRLSYRHKRSKFSVKTLGNLGLNYHAERQYLVNLPEESILATTIRSKSDFLAAQVSYEYIFKSNKVEKRKERIAKDYQQELANPFSRKKIQELKIGIHPTPFFWNKYLTLNYELFPTGQKKSIFLDVTYWNLKRGLLLDGVQDWYREPFLDIRLGQHLFSDAENAKDWGVGYYLRSEFNIFRSQKYIEDYQQKYGELHRNEFSLYAALGASLQYKWLIKDRWSIAPVLLCDLGVASSDARSYKYPVYLRPLYFDVQARLYVGYRF